MWWCVVFAAAITVPSSPSGHEALPSLAVTEPASPNVTSLGSLIAIVTAPRHEKARKAIRDTWLKDVPTTHTRFSAFFFIGSVEDTTLEKEVTAEVAQSKDIVRLKVLEKYENLGEKTLEIMSWAVEHGYSDVVKVDDDTFLNIGELALFLDHEKPTSRLYAGVIKENGVVIDDPSSKWYMRDQYPAEFYPRYAFGPCYFLGSALVRYIADHRMSLLPYRVEDAGVALWLQSQQPDPVAMPAFLYLASCADSPPQPVFVSPVNEHEMPRIHANIARGDVCGPSRAVHPYVLEECREHRCRCWPPPEEGCDENFSAGQYVDVIPRL